MDKLGTSLPPLQDLLIESGPSTSPPLVEYAAERADFLFRQYRRGEANDPDTYVAAAAAILSDYPAETIRYVTDPRTGLASNPWRDPATGYVQGGMPSPAHIKWACENHYGPTRRRIEMEERARKQLEERATTYLPDHRPKKGMGRISFKEFTDRGGLRPIGRFEDENNLPPGCKPLRTA